MVTGFWMEFAIAMEVKNKEAIPGLVWIFYGMAHHVNEATL